MDLRQNINKVHIDLMNTFKDVIITEKSIKHTNYFEISIKKDNRELKVMVEKKEIENNNFKWVYPSNPTLESSFLVERISSLDSIVSHVKDIFENNRFDSDYEVVNESNEFNYEFNESNISELIGLKLSRIDDDKITILYFDTFEVSVFCNDDQYLDIYGDYEDVEIINDIVKHITFDKFELYIVFESGRKLSIADIIGDGIQVYKNYKN